MQLGLVSAISLLAAISPALAETNLIPQFQALTDANYAVSDLFKDADRSNVAQNVPQAIEDWKKTILEPKKYDIEEFPQGVDEDEQTALCPEFINFATSSQTLIDRLVEKKSLLSATSYATAVGSVVRTDESLTKTLLTNIKGVLVGEDCKDAVAQLSTKLQEAYKKASDAYST